MKDYSVIKIPNGFKHDIVVKTRAEDIALRDCKLNGQSYWFYVELADRQYFVDRCAAVCC